MWRSLVVWPGRPRRSLSIVAGLCLLPAGLMAQTRSFSVCFTEGVRSCTSLELTTTAFYSGVDRIGTGIEVVVRHAEGADPAAAPISALSGFFFSYAGSTVTPLGSTDVSDELGMVAPLLFADAATTPAPEPLNVDGWRHTARSSTTAGAAPLFDNYLAFTNVLGLYDDVTGRVGTQMIGGCGAAAAGGVIDPVYTTELWTCGDGQYRFMTFTEAWFDVASVNTVGVTTYARLEGSDFGVAAWCNLSLDAPVSEGDATGDMLLGNVCAAQPSVGPELPVPEPGSWWLVLVGLGVLAGRRLTKA